MRIILFDLKKCGIFLNFFRYALVFVLIFSLIALGARGYYYSDSYIEAMIEKTEEKIIILDAGHGGEDCGAIGITGVYEKDLNLTIAEEIGELLTNGGYAVVYTRTQDKLLYTESENIKGIRKISDLKNRCKIAAEYPDALFVSIHMNSFSNEKYSGLQVYYSPEDEESRQLASSVQSSVKNSLQSENQRKIKKGEGMYVLENVDNTAILIECGFLSNETDLENLTNTEYQQKLAFACFCGIVSNNL